MSEAIDDCGGMTAEEYEAGAEAAREAFDRRAKALATGLTLMDPTAAETIVRQLRRTAEDARSRLDTSGSGFELTSYARHSYSATVQASETVADLVETIDRAPAIGSAWRVPGHTAIVRVTGLRISATGVDVLADVSHVDGGMVAGELAMSLTEWRSKGMERATDSAHP